MAKEVRAEVAGAKGARAGGAKAGGAAKGGPRPAAGCRKFALTTLPPGPRQAGRARAGWQI